MLVPQGNSGCQLGLLLVLDLNLSLPGWSCSRDSAQDTCCCNWGILDRPWGRPGEALPGAQCSVLESV